MSYLYQVDHAPSQSTYLCSTLSGAINYVMKVAKKTRITQAEAQKLGFSIRRVEHA